MLVSRLGTPVRLGVAPTTTVGYGPPAVVGRGRVAYVDAVSVLLLRSDRQESPLSGSRARVTVGSTFWSSHRSPRSLHHLLSPSPSSLSDRHHSDTEV